MQQEAGNVGEAHRGDLVAVHLVTRTDLPRRHVDDHRPRRLRLHQPGLQGEGDGADGGVPAHRQAAGRLDEQQAEVGFGAGRGVEDGAGHVRMPARFQHQRAANPVGFGDEVLASLAHCGAVQLRCAVHHHAHRHAFGVSFDTAENVPGHHRFL
ncbi:hypothetical protein D3C76_1298040 [compost metagenome]